MPTRSTGCGTCRKRKIRCDETRPHCKKCAIHGVVCPGYRRETEGAGQFFDETQSIIRKAHKTYGFDVDSPPSTVTIRSSQTPIRSSPSTPASFGQWSTPATTTTDKLDMVSFNSPLPLQLFSPEAERSQLFSKFIQIYLPDPAIGNIADHSHFFHFLAMSSPQNRGLRHSMDALSLVQIGSVHKDKRLLKRAVSSYSQALSNMSRDIARGDHLHDDEVLLAATLLTTCELYGEIASMGGWLTHVEGANQLVAARGPAGLHSDVAMLMFSNLKHGVLVKAMITRKAPFLAAPQWRALAWRLPAHLQDGSIAFYDAAVQVPGLLERFDNLDAAASPTALEEITALMQEAEDLETQLRVWNEMQQLSAKANGKVYSELRPIEEFEGFTSLCADRTFEEAFMFVDFYLGFLFSLHWQQLYHLRSTLRDLHRLRHQLDETWFPPAEKAISDDEILGYVLNICRSIPFFCEARSAAAGSVAIFLPMRTVALYFVYHGHWKYLKWVDAMRKSVFVKGLAPPDVSPTMWQAPSLKSAMRDGAARAASYSSSNNP